MYSPSEGKELFYPSPFYPCEILKYNPNVKRYYRNKNLNIPGNILLYCLYQFKERNFRDTNILDLDHIRRIPESPLQVFSIEVDRLFELFEKLSSGLQKKITVSRTAGIKTLNFGSTKEDEILKDVYGNNEEGRLLL